MTTALARPIAQSSTRIMLMPPMEPGGAATEALVRVSHDGILERMQAKVPLNPTHLYVVQGKTKLASSAYDRLNMVVGVAFIAPETLKGDDGRDHPNPWLIKEGHRLRAVRVRRIGLGRNAQGSWIAEDLTVTFDVDLYLAQDLISKWKGWKSRDGKRKGDPKEWGKLVAADAKIDLPPEKQRYELPGEVALIVDLAHPDVHDMIKEHTNRLKFCDRIATTVCRRNILRRFIPVSDVDPDPETGRAWVQVVGWTHTDKDWGQLSRLAAAANRGEITFEGEPVAIRKETAVITEQDDDVDMIVAEETDESSPQEPDHDADSAASESLTSPPPNSESKGRAKTEAAPASPAESIMERIREVHRRLDFRVANQAVRDAGYESLVMVNQETDTAKLNVVLKSLQDAELHNKHVEKAPETKPKTGAKKKAAPPAGTLLPDDTGKPKPPIEGY